MSDEKTTAYIKKMGDIRLSPEVRVRMREELSAFADFHAVRVATDVRSIDVQRRSVFTLFTNSHLRFMKATLLIALMVGLGGTSLAAQGAVPGDLLYPVKTNINENVRAAVTLGANAEAKLQADLLAERLEEAQKLAAKGELKGELAADVQTGISTQFQKTFAAGAKADAQTNTEVKATVEEALTSFAATVQNNTQVEGNFLSDLSAEVNTYAEGLFNGSVDTLFGIELAGDISVETIVQGARARLISLQNTIGAAAELNAEVKADFEAKLQEASTFVTNAQSELQAQAEAQAEANAQRANDILGDIESALSLMGQVEIDQNTGHIIDIDLSGTTSGGAGVDSDGGVEAIINGGADGSLQNDMIDTGINGEASGSAAGSLGI